ncbi:helix-turn-helix domain-containing protein [Bradyrhizobium tropiciagri]|uniref:helix-turn-helix domain-containing protein n=1 Tax=Bradyrhizobium tropiciagri TaxID=312253 RepID=UPI001BA53045|nr:helix-turn-helix domain-containing protein [Bradyrhizobium tropiciagri]MBR0898861.1 helix-turn-helix domain-containing protein [Bradyrhizobium tropiciagri]
MLLRRADRFRIYTDATQEELFRRTIGCCRLVYNLCLDQKILERERSRPRQLTAFDQMKASLKEEFDFLYEAPNHPLQQATTICTRPSPTFFERRAGFPTFRRKGQNGSFRYPDPKQIKLEKWAIRILVLT